MSNRPQSIPLTRFTRAAHQVVQDARERRMLLPGSDPKVDELENALDGLSPCVAPPEQLAFRETFLWRFHRPDVAAACRLVGDALFDLMNEAGEWGPEGGSPTLTHSELRAAWADLANLAVYLEGVAAERRASDLGETSAFLAQKATGWAGRLSQLVLDMGRSLDEAVEGLDPDSGDDHRPH